MDLLKGVVKMLGKYVRVRVTNPIRSVNRQFGFVYQLNFGAIEGIGCVTQSAPNSRKIAVNAVVTGFQEC